MIPEKPTLSTSETITTTHDASPNDLSASQSNDQTAMARLGKAQELHRNFRTLATIGFSSVFSCTWEYTLLSTSTSLINGGFSGAIYQYLWVFAGYLTVIVSLAEMASMAPTAGGQYHWVSEFAPQRWQRFLSYLAGWTCTVAWQPALPGGLYPEVTMVQSMRSYFSEGFEFQPWQATLLMIALAFAAVPLNTIWRRFLPMFESLSLVVHFVGFVVVLVTLCAMAPKNSAEAVFRDVENNGGWHSTGLAMMVGQVGILYTMAGADSAVHMAEEVDDAALTVPRAMVWSFVLNTLMGFGMMIAMCFCIGSLDDAINADEPFVNAFLNGTGSPAAATGLTFILLLILGCSNVTCIATESRQMWAFARDNGMPFSRWIAKVSKRFQVPLNAIWITMAVNIVLCLINLGSNLAFNIIIGISVVGTTATYIISIACLLSARFRGDELPPARWSLGRFGAPINIFAIGFASMMLVFSFFPVSVPVDPSTMNWTIVVIGAVLGFALVSYAIQGRKIYKGPVAYIEGKRAHGVIQTTEGDVTVEDGYLSEAKSTLT
ncbi:MAG: hypothetical protein Q9159_001455 [Coniocarpon cinnabarinum]